MKISDLKVFEGTEVTLHLGDGQVMRARVAHVDAEYEDIVVDVLRTNRPQRYRDPRAMYAVKRQIFVQ